MEQHQRQPLKLALVSLPLQGHINPMLQLASVLHSHGFSIIIVHPQIDGLDTSNHPLFKFVTFPVDLRDAVTAYSQGIWGFLLAICASLEEPLGNVLDGLVMEERIDCVIYDSIIFAVKTAAEKVGLPRIAFGTSSATFSNILASIPMMVAQKGHLPFQDCDGDAPITDLPPYRIRDLPDDWYKNNSSDHSMDVIVKIIHGVNTAKAIVFNTFEALEPSVWKRLQKQVHVPILPIGPLHLVSPTNHGSQWTQDRTCIEWLDRQPPQSVLYVSFGSLMKVEKNEMVEIAHGLVNSGQRFLWVVRTDSVQGLSEKVKLPPELEEDTSQNRMKIVKWAPQQDVLKHPAVGGFWTHCGWNSTLEGISGGVPMLCLPLGMDQNMNSRYLTCILKVGIALENGVERNEVMRGVRRLMVEDEGKEMRKRAMKIKIEAERAIASDGSSTMYLNKLVDMISTSVKWQNQEFRLRGAKM